MSSNITKDQQRAELLANQKAIKLTHQDEFRAIQFRRIFFMACTCLLAPVLSDFLKAKRKLWINNHKLDTDFLLNIMIEEFGKNPYFFPIYMENTESILKAALLGRTAVSHGFLPMILQEGQSFLSSWITLCHLVDHAEEAGKLQKIFNHLYSGIPDPSGKREDHYTIPEFVELSSTPRVMSFTEFEKSLLVQVYMMKADAEIFGPALRHYLVNEPDGDKYRNSVMDTQSYLMDLIERCIRRAWWPEKTRTLKCLYHAKDTRNLLFHAEIIPLLDRHENLFESWIAVCDLDILKLFEGSARILQTKRQLATLLSSYGQ
ncbi:hypothetical protein DAPPUDRAFT_325120 [Daphnia pulex]|uniref:Uncharacterized protein n=1 Tax=Daphnia pulex TaxID=6669 RepID=E9H3S6_DAPPU|nr:hypothetical protein DAPPUDRAFT_325120 [Daphnia pulex]|eukprot:EFX73573.1 hypothetical protein DAPPUDRAFT_325120 [Daphnia pulex]